MIINTSFSATYNISTSSQNYYLLKFEIVFFFFQVSLKYSIRFCRIFPLCELQYVRMLETQDVHGIVIMSE